MPFYKKRVEPEQRRSQDWQEAYQQAKQQQLYSGTQELGNGPYTVEIFTTHHG